jgi:GxxExxY protein
MVAMKENDITGIIIDAGIKVHSSLGPGLLESSYQECLYYELKQRGLLVQKEKPLPLIYEEVKLEIGYRVDLWVENKVVVEIKSVDSLNDVHMAQILTYLKLSNSKVGLLMNFNVKRLKDGLRRVVNNF